MLSSKKSSGIKARSGAKSGTKKSYKSLVTEQEKAERKRIQSELRKQAAAMRKANAKDKARAKKTSSNISKYASKIDNKSVTATKHADATDWKLQLLKKDIKKSKAVCSARHERLHKQVENICKSHPTKCPARKSKNKVVKVEVRKVACAAGFNDCSTRIYTYANGSRRLVTWYKKIKKDKVNKELRSGRIGDCGCGCNL